VMMEPTASEAAELRGEIDRLLAEIDGLRAKMRLDDEEIERSRARTQARLTELQAMFAKW
jgi:hypothetical protein